MLEWLASQHNLLPSFFVDFRRYHQAATHPNPNPSPTLVLLGEDARDDLADARVRVRVRVRARARVRVTVSVRVTVTLTVRVRVISRILPEQHKA